MKKNIFTLLASSGSLIAAFSTPSYGITPPGFHDRLLPNTSSSDLDSNYVEGTLQQDQKSVETRINQLARQTFSCTCGNCINATKQMVKEGTLSL